MDQPKIYLLLTDTGTIFTRLIKLYTRKPYNHVSLSFDRELIEVYSFGRKNPKNPFIGGFLKEDIRGDLFQKATCSLYAIPVTEQQLDRLKVFMNQFEKERESYHYNLIGLLEIIFQTPISRTNHFFCSEFVASVLHKCGILNFSKSVHLVTPYNFQIHDICQLTYQGELSHYLRQCPISCVTFPKHHFLVRILSIVKQSFS